jgi:hypothetical protein
VESLPEAVEALVRYSKLVAGEYPDWDDYRAAMECERRVLLRVTIDRVGPQRRLVIAAQAPEQVALPEARPYVRWRWIV